MNKALTLIPLLLPLLLPSCKKAHADTLDPQAQPGASEESGMDLVIRERVVYALQQERPLKPDLGTVQVHVKDGNVTLTGTASTEENRKRFYIVANAVGSVVRVDNQITVKQP
jgi:osmotically-inducible protein OsmY